MTIKVNVSTSAGVNHWIRQTNAGRSLFAAMVLFALFMRIAIPNGFMPTANADGFKISLCTGMGAVEMWLGKDGKIHKEDPNKGEQHKQPCVFAALGMGASVPIIAAVATLIRLVDTSPALTHLKSGAVGRGLAAPPPPQTGPPALI